jgi:hypothetical protein
MAYKNPWDIHPDLTKDRIMTVGRLLRHARNDALDRFDLEIGDDAWTLGCCAFQYSCHRITRSALSGDYPWLAIEDDSKRYVFRIGAVPVRFYKGAPDEPTARTLNQSFPELRQLSMVFPQEAVERNFAYRFAVETDADGMVLSISFVALLGDAPVLRWDIPLEAEVRPIHAVAGDLAEGVELAAPKVGVRSTDAGTGGKTGRA